MKRKTIDARHHKKYNIYYLMVAAGMVVRSRNGKEAGLVVLTDAMMLIPFMYEDYFNQAAIHEHYNMQRTSAMKWIKRVEHYGWISVLRPIGRRTGNEVSITPHGLAVMQKIVGHYHRLLQEADMDNKRRNFL